ncbi:sigma-54-dependent Fis family transcriptional regulator [uncultured Finegoldia sp.]|uniref:sigma-54 interaction domain-containing protein n=1 Tax=uncultured Finegoldia sp. TaxID=328009 RepID=UPI0026034EC2|nr:sigma 54-interacting transcriptional regulator [uncultured Finegoldia sp.]
MTKNVLNKDFLIRLLDKSNQGIHIVDPQGTTLYYNKFAEEIDGITKEEMIGKNMRDLVANGTFPSSVALDIIDSKKPKEVVQYIKDKVVIAAGFPMMKKGILEAVVVFTKDSKILKDMTLNLQDLLIENNVMATNLSKYNSKFLKEDMIISNSKSMQRVMKLANRICKLETPIFILGEAGSGKTMFAKYIHDNSLRQDKPFVKVDCSAIPKNIIESELFDDNNSYNESLIKQATNGTLFIDEIADMPLSCQRRLVYELNKMKENMRNNNEKSPTVRVIAASNENIDKNIANGKFRMDLFYLLNIIPIKMPSLRDRNEDIIPLINLFLNKYNQFYNEEKTISPRCKKFIINYSWPGNVRELENIIERLVVTSEGETIELEDVQEFISNFYTKFDDGNTFKDKIESYEKKLILEYSKQVSSIKELAMLACINESTLRKKIERYDLNISFS